MKIFRVDNIHQADAYTMKHEPIDSIDLMERASRQMAKWILNNFSKKYHFLFLIGKGNNAGDGLAIARMLNEYGYHCSYHLAMGGSGSSDFEKNLNSLRTIEDIKETEALKDLLDFSEAEKHVVWVDALFGSGLSRPIEGSLNDAIASINKASGIKVALDIPSGLFADRATAGLTFEADHTLSLQFPKLAFMVPENFSTVGKWEVLPIGLSKEYIRSTPSPYYFTEAKDLRMPSLSPFAHKGLRGRVTIIAGSYGQIGAAIMAAKAALRSGAGLLSIQTCQHCISLVQEAIHEALIIKDSNEYALGEYHTYDDQDVLAFGPAVGLAVKTRKLFKEILSKYKGQLVLDADAITMLAEDKSLLSILPEGTILTPHIGEFDRLVGKQPNHFERLIQAQLFAKRYACHLLLKGRYSAIADPKGNIFFNPTGNQGMAKGGSGDVLTGIIAALYPQTADSFKALQLATYIHGAAGDILAKTKSIDSYSPTDLIETLHLVQNKLASTQ